MIPNFHHYVRRLAFGLGVVLLAAAARADTIAAGQDFAGSIDSLGVLRTWGSNTLGQLGQGVTTVSVSQPAPVAGAQVWTAVAMGADFSLAVDKTKTLWAWGNNASGQLGTGGTGTSSSPVKVTLPAGAQVRAVAAGQNFGLALVDVPGLGITGGVYAWGAGSSGQLGQGNTLSHSTPILVNSGSRRYKAITANAFTAIAIEATTGTLWAWGDNSTGELGQGGTAGVPFSLSTPTQIGTQTAWTNIVGGYGHVLALRNGGELWTWGFNNVGQVGNGSNTGASVTAPARIAVTQTYSAIGAGDFFSYAIDGAGALFGWGLNFTGELDLPVSTTSATNFYLTPQAIGLEPGLAPWAAVTGGADFTVASTAGGVVFTVGNNAGGQLGNGQFDPSGFINLSPAFGAAQVSGVNLTITPPVVPSATIGVNSVVQPVTVTVQNTGSATQTGSYVVSLYLSTNGVIDSGSVLLASSTQSPPLAGLGSVTVTFVAPNVAIPGVTPGSYSLISQVTPVGGISVNGGATAVTIVGPDLTLGGLAVAGSHTVPAGGAFTGVTATLSNGNLGVVPAGVGLLIKAYLGTTTTHNPAADVQIGQFTFSSGLAAGAAVALPAQSFTVPASMVGGVFQLIYTVNENNAVKETGALLDSAATTVSVQSYDLAVSAPTLPTVGAAADGGAQIIGTNATLGFVNVSAQNIGSQAFSGGFTVSLYLSTDGTVSPDDTLVASITDGATLVATGSRLEQFTNVVVPAVPPGAYQLLANITPAPGNSDATLANNTAGLPVRVKGPDFAITNAVLPGGTVVSPGGSLVGVTYTLRNLNSGVLPAGSGSQLLIQTYLSTSSTFSAATATLLDSFAYTSGLAAGPSAVSLPLAPRTITVPAGTPGGSYNLFFVVNNDGAFAESGATDGDPGTSNDALAVPITVSSADLAVTVPVTATTSFGVNTTLGSVAAFVQNQGAQAYAAGFTMELYLSASPTLDGTAILLQSISQNGPLPSLGSSLLNWINVAIPDVAPGGYFLLSHVVLAAGQTDSNLANNTAATAVTLVGPTFSLSNFVFPNTTSVAAAGGTFGNVSYRLTNLGAGAVPASRNVSIEVFLSTDTTLDRAADVLLDQYTFTGGLAAGGSVTLPVAAHPINLPQNVLNGIYNLIFVVNGTGAVVGAQVAVTAQQVAIGALDASVTAPALSSTSLGVNTALPSTSVTVNNLGGFDIPPGTVVSLYLSTDAAVDLGDTLLGTQTITTTISAGASRAVTFAGITVPDFGQGPFDLVSQITLPPGLIDLNLANNTAATPVTLQRPSLQISNIVAPNSISLNGAGPFQLTGVSFTLSDGSPGAVPAGTAVLLEVYLSSTPVFNPAAETLLFASSFTGGLSATASATIPAFNVPISATTVGGNYFLIFAVNRDRNVNESSSVVATGVRQVFLQKTNAPGQALSFGTFGFGGNAQWSSVTDNKASGSQTFQTPALSPGQVATLTMSVTGPTTIRAPWLIVGSASDTVAYTIDGVAPPAQSSGLLVADETYTIVNFVAGDDFSNVGVTTTTPGTTFVATGTTPNVWTHGTSVQPVSVLTGFAPSYQSSVISVPAGTHTITWTYTQNSASASSFARLDLDLPSFIASGDGSWFGVIDNNPLTGTTGAPVGGTYAESPALQTGQQAALSVTVSGPAMTNFWWRTDNFGSVPDTLSFFIDGQLAQLPTTSFFTDPVQAVISGTTNWANVAFLLGPGTHTLSWVYAQNSTTTTSAAYVDGLQVLSPIPATNAVNRVTNPADHAAVPTSNLDLKVSSVVAPTGTYLLDDANGSGRLPVTIGVTNGGADFSANPSFAAADLEIHLSTNTTFGDADDIDLGSFAQLDTLVSGNQAVFSGAINLPFTIPTGNYFLLVRYAGATNQPEFTLANNTAVVGPGFNVTRAARIVISSFSGLASNYPYHPEDPVFIQYTIGNTGLADVTPSEPFNVQVNLRAVSAGATDFTSSTLVKSFTPVSNSLFLPAASGQFPNGGSSRVTNFLSLPTERDLLVALSLIPAGTPEDDARVAANVASLANFEFFFEVIEDSTNVIVQSSPSNIFSFTSTFSITATPQQQSAGQYFGQTIFGTFVNSNNAGLSGTTFNGASAADQAFTSLILNYATGQTLAGSPQTLFQSTTQNGFPSLTVLPGGAGTFLTQTFDFNVRADDLTIQVQSSPDLVTWTTLVTLTPPYFGTSGTHSLTGFGGLTDNPFVLSVAGNSTDVQQVYTARVTVRDSVPAVSSGSRFMRLNVVPSVAVPAAPTGLTANYDPTLSESNLSWSASPALPTVLDPLGSGAQITVGAYVIERAAAATPTVFDIVGSTTSTTFSESLAAPTNTTTTYTYRVRAITSGGTSAAASAVETVP